MKKEIGAEKVSVGIAEGSVEGGGGIRHWDA
jgi:hypothetical protein